MLEMRKEAQGGCRFIIKSEQGNTLLESIAFDSATEAETSLRKIRPAISDPVCFERRTDHRGLFQFALKSPGGPVLGHSQFYRSEAGMENGITHTRDRIVKLML